MSLKIDLAIKKAKEKVNRSIEDSIDKKDMEELASFAANMITKRTRLGYGVSANGQEKSKLEKLKGSYCEQNIYINTDYPPFQQYVSFYDIYRGFPVTHKIKQFMLDALALGSDEIWKYKELIQVPDDVEVSA